MQHKDVRYLSAILVAAWLAAAGVSSIMGMLQFFGVADGMAPWISHASPGEVFANLRQRNQFASLMCIGVAALLWVPRLERWHFAAISLAVLLAAADAASASRTGFVAIVTVSGLALWWRRSDHEIVQSGLLQRLVAVGLGYGLVALIFPLVLTELQLAGVVTRLVQGDAACASRLTLWSNVLHLIAQKPWFGWGWGELDYAHFITLYPGKRFCDILDNAHNLPLHLAVELGMPVAAMVCGVVAWLVWRAKPWAEPHPTRQLAWAVLAVIGLHSLLEYPLWYGPFQVTVVLCVWMLHATRAKPEKFMQKKALAPALSSIAASILIAICTYAAWDYWRISQIYLTPAQRHAAYRADTLSKIQGSWLFQNQVKFAELTITELTPANAEHQHELALSLLHFSPEPRVVEKLTESATILGKDAEAVYYLQRFKAAYPADYQKWKK